MAETNSDKLEPLNEKKSICIYPLFINSKRTLVEGRRIKKENAVEDPTTQEIYDILTHIGFKCVQEKKMHPHDASKELTAQGRVRVRLKNDDGTPANSDYPTRMSLMLYAAEMIPKLKTRQTNQQLPNSQPLNAVTEKQKKRKK